MSFEWLKEMVDANSVPNNFQEVDLSTRRVFKKILPDGQLVVDIASPEVTWIVEAQMSKIC